MPADDSTPTPRRVVDPVRDERGWAFRDGPSFSSDRVNGFAFLEETGVFGAITAN